MYTWPVSAESEMYAWGWFLNRISDAIEFVIPNKFHNILDFSFQIEMMIIFVLISNIIWEKKFYLLLDKKIY